MGNNSSEFGWPKEVTFPSKIHRTGKYLKPRDVYFDKRGNEMKIVGLTGEEVSPDGKKTLWPDREVTLSVKNEKDIVTKTMKVSEFIQEQEDLVLKAVFKKTSKGNRYTCRVCKKDRPIMPGNRQRHLYECTDKVFKASRTKEETREKRCIRLLRCLNIPKTDDWKIPTNVRGFLMTGPSMQKPEDKKNKTDYVFQAKWLPPKKFDNGDGRHKKTLQMKDIRSHPMKYKESVDDSNSMFREIGAKPEEFLHIGTAALKPMKPIPEENTEAASAGSASASAPASFEHSKRVSMDLNDEDLDDLINLLPEDRRRRLITRTRKNLRKKTLSERLSYQP